MSYPNLNLIIFAFISLSSMFVGAFLVYRALKPQIERLKQLTNIDPLTGLYDASKLQKLLAFEVQRAKRYKNNVSVILFEIDDFDSLTEKFSAANNDHILKQISHIILNGDARSSKQKFYGIRNSDIAFRCLPSSKFLILLPETKARGAQIAAERIREIVMHYRFEMTDSKKFMLLSMSAGIVSFNHKNDTLETLLQRAEMMLTKAKMVQNNVAIENPINNVLPLFKKKVSTQLIPN